MPTSLITNEPAAPEIHRHLEIAETGSHEFGISRIMVTEQSHRCNDFAVAKDGHQEWRFFAENFELSSVSCPQAYRTCEGKRSCGLFVRGSNGSMDNHEVLSRGSGYLKNLRAAVASYNAHNGVNYQTEQEWWADNPGMKG